MPGEKRQGYFFYMRSKSYAKIVCIFVSFITFTTGQLFAADQLHPQISTSSLSQLLNHPTVTAIYKDKLGLVWLGTQYGLYRVNGHKKRFFSTNSSGENWIPASDIRAITENSRGEILVATFGAGIAYGPITDLIATGLGKKREK